MNIPNNRQCKEVHNNLKMYFMLCFIMYLLQWQFTQWHSFESHCIEKFVETKLFYFVVNRFYCFFTVLYSIFPLTSAPGALLILKLWGAVLIWWRWLKEGDTYFKVREIIHMKLQKFAIFSFEVTINNCHYDI